MNKLLTLVVAITAATIMSANAAEPKGWYIGAGAGISSPLTDDVEGDVTDLDITNDYKIGWAVDAFVGYDFGIFRTDVEVAYRSNSISDFLVTSPNGFAIAPGESTTADGKVKAFSVMLNGYIDFPINDHFVPYLGAGVGLANIKRDMYAVNGVTYLDDGETRFAFQGIAGVKIPIDDNLSIHLDYRYLNASGQNLVDAMGNDVDVNGDYQSHTVLLGLTYHFGKKEEPAPAPVVVPEVTPEPRPEPFLVFFDFDESVITPEAARIIRNASEQVKRFGIARLKVVGHADRSGSVQYNQGLSERRAEAVKRELIANGLSASEIYTEGRSELDPLVPTEDGVREPQNRRAEVTFD